MRDILNKLKNFIRFIFHKHKWKIIKEQETQIWGNYGEKYPIGRKINYILQCEECGKLLHKKYKL